MSKKTKKILLSIPKVLLLCAIGIKIFLPLLWMFFSAFKPPKDIISYPPTFVPAEFTLGQHRTIAEASAVESPIRQETIGFPAHFFARAHNFKPPGRACQPEADSPMRT